MMMMIADIITSSFFDLSTSPSYHFVELTPLTTATSPLSFVNKRQQTLLSASSSSSRSSFRVINVHLHKQSSLSFFCVRSSGGRDAKLDSFLFFVFVPHDKRMITINNNNNNITTTTTTSRMPFEQQMLYCAIIDIGG
jgi:hypothetical protein